MDLFEFHRLEIYFIIRYSRIDNTVTFTSQKLSFTPPFHRLAWLNRQADSPMAFPKSVAFMKILDLPLGYGVSRPKRAAKPQKSLAPLPRRLKRYASLGRGNKIGAQSQPEATG